MEFQRVLDLNFMLDALPDTTPETGGPQFLAEGDRGYPLVQTPALQAVREK